MGDSFFVDADDVAAGRIVNIVEPLQPA